MSPARPPQRVAAVDALRALALLPVVAINWVGYPALPDGGPLSPPAPADSAVALVLSWCLHALVAGKGIAMLAFLFGYSQGLSQSRGVEALAKRRRRLGKLLVLGLLHGTLLYMGDILTLYAVAGSVLAMWAGYSMTRLKLRLRVLVGLELAVIALTVVLSTMPLSNEASVPLSTPASWGLWTLRNASHFLATTITFVLLGLPVPLFLMTAGLMAARLRLFSHPRWEPALRRWSRRWLWPAVAVNVAFGSLLWPGLRDGDAALTSRFAIFYLYPTMLLLSAAVPALVLWLRRDPRWLGLLAPLGRHTLTLYLFSSVLSFVLFGGVGLAWQPGTAVAAGLALAYWIGGLLVAQALGPRRLPLERWLSR
ncbi:DUF418 domain-containing protein [Mitsuaria sp. GD03876]|uniref:DUF418 domain-containing protein n=1 Tax=Mitsuaria sp. GD03876 TaxID=2975399 RepID=UPI00244914B0|nr:DUF418 domain-containing protein [Mitsuaria sp. GD03876]MDH0867629.1 DUF418 domain-containing protein [Mitsuaria sp. GD03876]